jgi:hypothetical protein
MGARVRDVLKVKLAALAGLSPLLCAAPAVAAEPFQTGGAGVFFGYAFGERGGFEWGLEGFATRYLSDHNDCSGSSGDERSGFGPVFRLSAVELSRLELTLAAHIGSDLPNSRTVFAAAGEAGVSLMFDSGQETRVGPHYGALVEAVFVHVYLRQAWLFEFQEESVGSFVSLGGGARLLPTMGSPGFCVEGRPYRGGCGEARRARVARGSGFDVRNARAERWARRAAEEGASVPAFLQLAQELLELDAPIELVARAVHAADEELGHTRAAVALAEHFGGAPIRVVPPKIRERPRLRRAQALRRLAAESFHDGCLNEGLAAQKLLLEAQRSDSAREARVLERVAREEATHAALALDIVRWASQRR